MSQRFLLERHFISRDYDRQQLSRTRAVGELLKAVFQGPPRDPGLDKLVERLPPSH